MMVSDLAHYVRDVPKLGGSPLPCPVSPTHHTRTAEYGVDVPTTYMGLHGCGIHAV